MVSLIGIKFETVAISMIAVVILCQVVILWQVAYAEEDLHVMFVNSSQSGYTSNLSYNTITTAIYSPVEQPAVVTIYVQDEDLTPIGIVIFKTTLLAGTTPIEYGFTEPIECYYNTYDHKPICNTDTPNTIYVNVFKDTGFTVPLTSEFVGEMV